MKSWSVPLALLLLISLIVSLGYGSYHLLQKGSTELLLPVERIKESVLREDWLSAEKHFRKAVNTWQRENKYWPMLINHQEMDNIEECLNSLKSHLHYKNSNEAVAELYNLIFYIKHIPEKESLNLKNIL